MQVKEKYSEVHIKSSRKWGSIGNDPIDTRLEFGTATKLRNFINSNSKFCKLGDQTFMIIKIRKVRHTSIFAYVKRMTLREYNLEILLS
jgi:hypothetical protein